MSISNSIKYWLFADRLIRRNPLFYSRFKRRLDHLNSLDRAGREKESQKHIEKTLKDASKSKWARNNNQNSLDLNDWPYFDKNFVRDQSDNILTASKALSIKATTSGSTGIPINLYRSLKSVAQEQASIDYVCEKEGIDLSKDVIGLFRGDSIKDVNDNSQVFHKKVSPEKIVFSSSHISGGNISTIHEILIEENVTVLMGYPSAIEELFRLLKLKNLTLKLKGIVTSSEVLTLKARELFLSISPNTSIVDYYGLAERMIFSYSTNGKDHYFLFGYAHVELIYEYSDDQFDYFEAIGTSFINSTMPFIRYKTGDLIKVDKGTSKEQLNDVCLGLNPFRGIEGRTVDYLITESGERLVGMTFIPRGVDNIYRLQIEQTSTTEVSINVLIKDGFSDSDKNQILSNARSKIPNTINIKLKVVTQLQKNSSGKIPYVLHNFNK